MTDATQQSGPSIALEWWRSFNPADGSRSGTHRAALARIRRAATVTEVLLEPEALRLVQRLPHSQARAAILAGVLAHVRDTEDVRVARAIGRRSLDDEQSALVSEGRFRRLMQTRDQELMETRDQELMETMRRLVRLMKGRANVHDLSAAILHWGEKTRQRWIFDYYGVAFGADSTATASSQSASSQSQS